MNSNANKPVNGEMKQIGDVAVSYGGMTLREHYAGLAMQGVIAGIATNEEFFNWDESDIANHAVRAADALLAELEK